MNIEDVLREVARSAYWYGEETGDYEMTFVYNEDWFQEAKVKIEEDQMEKDAEIEDLRDSRDFYKRRCDELQKAQRDMRDPERKAVCDILANGKTAALAMKNVELK